MNEGNDAPADGGGGEEQEDQVQVAPRLTMMSPDSEPSEAEAAALPTVAASTKDPNRATIYVPYDKSIFSMGQAGPKWIPDKGITAKTDNHIHWFVVGTDDAEENTIVTLGGPATAHTVEAHVGGLSSSAVKGYAMVTSGIAWHDAKLQQVMISRTEDVTIRTAGPQKKVGIQSDTGKVLMFGEQGVAIGSKDSVRIGADPSMEMKEIGVKTPWLNEWVENIGAKLTSQFVTAGEIYTSAKAINAALAGGVKEGEEGKWGWKFSTVVSKAKMAADLVLFASTAIRGAMEYFSAEVGGSVGVAGKSFVSITAGVGATMFGNLASAIVSGGQAEVLGGVSALVKGLAYTEIASGVLTGVTSIKTVEVAASKGNLEMTAGKEVTLSALGGAMLLTAEKQVQLCSVEKTVTVHAKNGAYVGAGVNAGYGLEAKTQKLRMGKVAKGGEFEDPEFEDECLIMMKQTAIELTLGESILKLNKKGAELTASKIKVKAEGNTVIDGEKIIIG